jgi:hypothetical protein
MRFSDVHSKTRTGLDGFDVCVVRRTLKRLYEKAKRDVLTVWCFKAELDKFHRF